MDRDYRIQADLLKKFGQAIFQKVGVPDQHAKETAEILVDANLRGIDTHGIYLSNLYARRLQKQLINPSPKFHYEKKKSRSGYFGC